jgi:hypothetical protein
VKADNTQAVGIVAQGKDEKDMQLADTSHLNAGCAFFRE